MNFFCLTLFPELVENAFNTSITGRAVKSGLLSLECINIRDFAGNKHGKVDDYTYGGGAGLLMQAEPVFEAFEAAAHKIDARGGKPARVLYMSPQGKTFNQEMAKELAQEENLIFLCGHYEGIDERVINEIVTDEISLGDFVLTGGELAAAVMMDAIARMVPGVLHNEMSGETDSFYNGLIEYSQYTRPEEWHGQSVPGVLISGAHDAVEEFRYRESLKRTHDKRPDLYKAYRQEHPVEPEKIKRMHLSLDDFFGGLAALADHPEEYASVFENAEFGLLKKLHDKYGAVFSCYCFFNDEKTGRSLPELKLEDRFTEEFKENSDWLKFGSHSLEDYAECTGKLKDLVGSEAIDLIPRIHYFKGSYEECVNARKAGALGLLCADDDRVSYCHTGAQHDEMHDKGIIYDGDTDLFFVRTDVRLEKCKDVWESLKPYPRNKVNRSLVVFTHEYYLDDREAGMAGKLETACKFALKNNYVFEFPMNWVR